MTSQSFPDLLSHALDSRGVSPGEAARALKALGLKIDRGTITRWRNGESTPSIEKRAVLRYMPRVIGLSPAEEAAFLAKASRMLGFDIDPDRGRRPPPRAIPQRIHFGDEGLARFAGREAELAALQRLVLRRQSVIITGMGGVGKTRLAQEVLRANVGHFAHGCELMAIAPGQAPAQVVRTIAYLLGIELPATSFSRDGRLIPGRLREHLPGLNLLFLVDNVEKAEQVQDLVRELPAVTWIFTARRLNLLRAGVQEYKLTIPSPEGAAAIFNAYAGAEPRAALGGDPAAAVERAGHVAKIVEQTGGLPIALRLLGGLLANGVFSSAGELKDWLLADGLRRPGTHTARLHHLFTQLVNDTPVEARAVFEVCGLFAARTIRMTHLRAVCQGAGITLTARTLDWLTNYSLIDAPTAEYVTLHPLLHAYAGARVRKIGHYSLVLESYQTHYLNLARSVADHTHEVERNYGQLLAEEGNLLAVAESFYQTREWSQLKAMWPALSGYLWNAGDRAAYAALDRRCLEAAEATGDADWQAVILSELGFVALESDAWDEAADLLDRSQALHDAAADQVIEQARLRRYRAALAMKRGQPDEALRLLNECEALLMGEAGETTTGLSAALMLLYSARMSVHARRGDWARAEKAGIAANRAYEALTARGEGHRLGEFRLEYGDIRFRQGHADEARRIWLAVLTAREVLRPLPEQAEAGLRLIWLAATSSEPSGAHCPTTMIHETLTRHGRSRRADEVDSLLAAIESGTPPTFETLIAGCLYPAY